MIQIEKTAYATTKIHKGKITASVSGSTNTEWEFELHRTVNGSTVDRIFILTDEMIDEAPLELTILANLKKEQVQWV